MSKQLSLSKIAVALSLAYASSMSYAEIQSANGQTQVSRQGAVEIINIATPSQAGLSHNQYNKFNVDKAGAVLNNAQQQVRTELAGNVAKNPNLKNGSARVILNEVVSKNPSKILGKQEIAGQRADYVLANPNGISVENGGFINTPKASLVVGKPTVANGKLTGYDVNSENKLTSKGTLSGNNDLNLIAPQVSVSSQIKTTGDVNVVQGRNRIDRDENGRLTIKVLPQQGKVLDGKVAGSMQANRIRIHSTDQRATINLTGSDLTAKQVVIGAGNAKLNGEITTSENRFQQEGVEGRRVKVRRNQNSTQQQYKKTNIETDTLVLVADNNLEISGANIQAKQAVISGGKTHFGTQKTANSLTNETRQSKGKWYRNETDFNRTETAHRTTVQADNLKVLATNEKITGNAVKLSAQNLGVYGKKGVELKGEKETNQYRATADFRNETAKLKTGSSYQQATAQNYVATELNARNLVLGGEGNIQLSGVKAQVEGDFINQSQGKVIFNAESVKNDYVLDDHLKFWGGLAGSKALASTRNDQVQNGSDVTVKGTIFVDAQNGVQLSGSRVLATQNAYVKANNGNLVIDAVQNKQSQTDSQRQGTIFDITKARQSSFSHSSTAQGSQLRSESNLQLTSNKNIDVVGSSVQAVGSLDISALKQINVSGAENSLNQGSQNYQLGVTAKAEKPTINLDKNVMIDTALNNVQKLVKGEIKPLQALQNVAQTAKDNLKFTAQASATLGINNTVTDSQATTHTGASLAGGTTHLTADQINVAGSQVNSAGDLNLNAQRITTTAQQNQQTDRKRETNAGITDTVKATESEISNTLTIGVTHSDNQTQTSTAQTSQLNAKGNLNLNANQIAHQGSTLTAGQNLVQNAQSVSQTAATNQVVESGKNVNVGATLTTAIDKSKAINGSLELNAEGGNSNSQTQTAQATTLTANNIATTAKQINDVGTQYQANQGVSLNSQQHNLQAAQNSQTSKTLNAGVTVGIEASSKDLNTVDANVNVGAKFQQNQTASTTAQKAQVQGTNVAINTQQLNSQADISGSQSVAINAQNAHFAQAQNSESKQGGGFESNLKVGALVIPAAGAAVPSVDVSAKVNAQNSQSTQAVSTQIQGGDVAIKVQNQATLQGTNLQANTVTLTANRLNVSAAQNQTNSTDVKVGAGVKVGAKVSNLGVNGNLNVAHENSQTSQASELNAQTLNINAQTATLSGVNGNSNQLNLNANDLNLNGVQNTVNKTKVGTSLALNGGVAEQKWTPNGGSASLAVDVVRNQTTTPTTLNSETANLNVAGTTSLVGSTINAEQANGTLNNVNSQSVVNRINETSVALSASGSGKFSAYPADKWQESAKKDWENGTIAGVKAEVSINANATRKQTNALAGVMAKKNNTLVKGNVIANKPATERKQSTQITGKVNTNAKAMLQQAKQDIKNKRTPLFQVSRQR